MAIPLISNTWQLIAVALYVPVIGMATHDLIRNN